jgi:hypothetical protein
MSDKALGRDGEGRDTANLLPVALDELVAVGVVLRSGVLLVAHFDGLVAGQHRPIDYLKLGELLRRNLRVRGWCCGLSELLRLSECLVWRVLVLVLLVLLVLVLLVLVLLLLWLLVLWLLLRWLVLWSKVLLLLLLLLLLLESLLLLEELLLLLSLSRLLCLLRGKQLLLLVLLLLLLLLLLLCTLLLAWLGVVVWIGLCMRLLRRRQRDCRREAGEHSHPLELLDGELTPTHFHCRLALQDGGALQDAHGIRIYSGRRLGRCGSWSRGCSRANR